MRKSHLTLEPPVIGPRVNLSQIIIDLPKHGAPVVTMTGEVSVTDRRVGRVSEGRFVTYHLTEEGRRFIQSMVEAFAVTPPQHRGEPAP